MSSGDWIFSGVLFVVAAPFAAIPARRPAAPAPRTRPRTVVLFLAAAVAALWVIWHA